MTAPSADEQATQELPVVRRDGSRAPVRNGDATPIASSGPHAPRVRSAPSAGTAPPPRSGIIRARRRVLTVRARVLAAVVTLAALGLFAAGGSAYLLERGRIDTAVDASLTRHVDELRALAARGIDPESGAGFTSVRDVLRSALQRTVPGPNEGMFAMIDGQVELVPLPEVAPLRLETVDEVVAAARVAQGQTVVTIRTVETADRSFRYVATPVSLVGDPARGVLVVGVDREAEHSALVRTYRTYMIVALAALAVLGVVGWVVAGRLLSPLRLLRDTAQRITDSDLSERIPVSGADDISDLARTVNSMLDRLEAGFGAQRTLLDDAGHELRTPRTIVRGHLELMDPSDPDDVRSTQELVLDEVDRMHRLVDDLVVLATVDRPDFTRPVPTDVGRLTDDVLDKARTLGSQRWLVESRADVVVRLDPQRVTQAWLQLAANAAKYSPPGSTIRLGSTLVAGPSTATSRESGSPPRRRVVLSVHDEGPGVRAGDAERIFARFARGGSGRGVEGAGLGLPIVRAIAAAHGGSAYLDPSVTRGARFVLTLPLSPSDEAASGAAAPTEEDVTAPETTEADA